MKSFLLGASTSLAMLNIVTPAEWKSITIFVFLLLLSLFEIVSPVTKREKEK